MLYLSFLLATMAGLTSEAKAPHIHVALITQEQVVAEGGTCHAGIHFTMDPGWHVYWRHPGDSGEAPALGWQLPQGWSAGDIAWPLPQALPVPPLMNYGYAPEVLLAVPIQVGSHASTTPVTLATHVSWLVCAESCIPGSANLAIAIGVGKASSDNPQIAPLFERTRKALPEPLPSDMAVSATTTDAGFTLHVASPQPISQARFFPTEGLVLEEAAEQRWQKTAAGYDLALHHSEQLSGAPAALRGLLEVTDAQGAQRGWPIDAKLSPAAPDAPAGDPISTDSAHALGPLQVIWFALLGGIILNLMPCVFPVLSIKVMSLMRLSGHEQKAVRRHAWLYTLGILVGFWVLTAVLLGLRAAGERIGWGFQLQSPGFVAGLAILLFMFGLSLLGVFEVGASWMGVGQSVAGRRDAVGSFFTGLLATVVATPCSAPFMGSAVGFALTQAPWVCAAIFSSLGLGLALPYVALCYLPQLSRWMPKPGAWMQSMQQFMGFMLMGTVLWLLWVLQLQMGSEGLFVLLSMLLGLAVAGWVLGRWGHHHRAIAIVAWFAILGIGGGAIREIVTMGRTKTIAAANHASNLSWEKFSPERVRTLRAEGRRIFVDFTAAWCVSCQVNERVVFGSSAVREKIAERDMVLLKADWTDADPVITEALAAFGRSGVPLYVLYGRGETTPPVQLPEVITPAMVLDALGKLP